MISYNVALMLVMGADLGLIGFVFLFIKAGAEQQKP